MATPAAGIIDTRVLGKPGHFSGKETEFRDFKFQVIVYCGLVEPELPAMIKISAQQEDEIKMDPLTPDQRNKAKMLYYILAMLTSKRASRIVRREENSLNGFEAWRKMISRYEPRHGARYMSLL